VLPAEVEPPDVLLTGQDRADGVPKHVQVGLFEPFFTTKPPGKGSGMCLAIAFGAVTEIGGTIYVPNACDGAVFKIRLRRAF
jgi:C4-dicarboxylate-specific signal transduction histidine kinase